MIHLELDGPETNAVLEVIKLHIDHLKYQREQALDKRYHVIIDSCNERIAKWSKLYNTLQNKVK
jgi:hypothetical protein